MQLVVKTGNKLTDKEFEQINNASLREFQVGLTSIQKLEDKIIFLLLEDEHIFAQGQLLPIKPVGLNNVHYSLLGIGGIVAHEKSKGYGTQIMRAIKDYLVAKNKTGIGFCMPENTGFYEKCGFLIDTTSTHRFMYRKKNKTIIDQWGQHIFYYESNDHFMRNVLTYPDKEIVLPIPPTW